MFGVFVAICPDFCYHKIMKPSEQSIIATLVYFDIFDYPLTLIELRRFILQLIVEGYGYVPSLKELDAAMADSEILRKSIRFKNGFFYLKGKEDNVRKRLERYVLADKKYKAALRVARIISRIPFVRFIGVCNSLAYSNTSKESDIDLVIITRPGGAWWARALSLLFLSLFRLRPGQGDNQDKICLSVFLDEDNLDLRDLRMGKRDIDFTYWAANFYPLYDAGGYFERFWRANRSWINESLPAAKPALAHASRTIFHAPAINKAIEYILLPLTPIIRELQKKKFPNSIRLLVNVDTRVRVQDGLLKFHVNDRRLEHMEKFVEKYEKVIS